MVVFSPFLLQIKWPRLLHWGVQENQFVSAYQFLQKFSTKQIQLVFVLSFSCTSFCCKKPKKDGYNFSYSTDFLILMISHVGYTKASLLLVSSMRMLQNLVTTAGSAFLKYEIMLICYWKPDWIGVVDTISWYLKLLLHCKGGYLHSGEGPACWRAGTLVTVIKSKSCPILALLFIFKGLNKSNWILIEINENPSWESKTNSSQTFLDRIKAILHSLGSSDKNIHIS